MFSARISQTENAGIMPQAFNEVMLGHLARNTFYSCLVIELFHMCSVEIELLPNDLRQLSIFR